MPKKTYKKDCGTQGCQNDAKRGYSMSNGTIWLCPECDTEIKGWAGAVGLILNGRRIDMVNIRITQMQLQELLLWGAAYADERKETGVKFEKDEIDLYKKLFLISRKQFNETEEESLKELYCRNPEWKED